MTQNENILRFLKKGKRINPLQALNKFGCFRLASRISDLKSEGNSISSEMISKGGTRFKEYWI